MPLRQLRPGKSHSELKRRSTLDPAGFFKRADKDSRARDADHGDAAAAAAARVAVSVDGGSRPSYDARPSTSHDDDTPPSPPVQEPTPNTRRFSLMRFRHASDSQLSTKAKEQAARDQPPPMPAVPAVSANPERMCACSKHCPGLY